MIINLLVQFLMVEAKLKRNIMTRTILNSLIIISMLPIGLTSCKKECEEIVYKVESFENLYGCQDTRHGLIIDLTNEAIIIISQTGFNSLVEGTCTPSIDFTKYDLIIGKKITDNRVDTIYYDYRADCPDRAKVLQVEIIQSAITTPDTVVYHALIPKLSDAEGVTLNIVTSSPAAK